MLELCTLGTGGTLPLADRALSSLYMRENGRAMIIDCGEGTQVGIRKLGWGFRVEAVIGGKDDVKALAEQPGRGFRASVRCAAAVQDDGKRVCLFAEFKVFHLTFSSV